MSALEDEIIQKFRLLDKTARERVLLQIQQDTPLEQDEATKTLARLEWANDFRARTQMREERLDDILGSG